MTETATVKYPLILAEVKTPRASGTCAGAVVLRDFGPGRYHRYVTHWRNDDLGGHNWGHYYDDEAKAKADFADRCKRGY